MQKYIKIMLVLITILFVYLGFSSYSSEYFSEQGGGTLYNDFKNAEEILDHLFTNIRNSKLRYEFNHNSLNVQAHKETYDNTIENITNHISRELDGYQNTTVPLPALLTYLISSLDFVDVFDNTEDEKKKLKNILGNRLSLFHKVSKLNLYDKINAVVGKDSTRNTINNVLNSLLSPAQFSASTLVEIKNLLHIEQSKLQEIYKDSDISSNDINSNTLDTMLLKEIYIDSYIYSNDVDCNTLESLKSMAEILNSRALNSSDKLTVTEVKQLDDLITFSKCIHTQMVAPKVVEESFQNENNNKNNEPVDKCLISLDSCKDITFDYFKIKDSIESGTISFNNWLGIVNLNNTEPYLDIIGLKLVEIHEIIIAVKSKQLSSKDEPSGTTTVEEEATILGNNTNKQHNKETEENETTKSINNQSVHSVIGGLLNTQTEKVADISGAVAEVGKPYTNENNEVKPEPLYGNSNNEILHDKSCDHLTTLEEKQACRDRINGITYANMPSNFKNKPLSNKNYKAGKTQNLINTKPFFNNDRAYNVNEVNPTGNLDYVEGKHSPSAHVWTSNNIDDNLNRMNVRPLIVQSGVRGVSNIFAPVIYIKDGQTHQPVNYDYKFNNETGQPDMLNSVNEIQENNEDSMFEKNNVIIPS